MTNDLADDNGPAVFNQNGVKSPQFYGNGEGVFAPGGRDCLAHPMQKVINIVGLTAIWLAFFIGIRF